MLPKSSLTRILRSCLAIGALVSVLSGSAANGSPPDHLSPDRVECVMAAYRNKRDDRYGGFAVNPRNGMLTVSRRNHVDLWGECAARPLQSLTVETGVADKTQISTNARYLLASRYMGAPVEIFDLSGARQPIRLPNCQAQGVLSPSEDVAVVQCSEGVRLVDLTSGAFVGAALRLEPSAFSMATNTLFDRLVIGTASGTLALISIEKTDKGYSLSVMTTWDTGYGAGEWITPVAFSADERQIISVGRGGQLDVWDASNGALLRHWQADLMWVGTATFARNQRYVALFGQKAGSSAQNRVQIIEVETGKRMVSVTPYNYQYAVYIESLDRLLVAGPNTPPYLLDLPPDRRESTGSVAQAVCANSVSRNCLRVALEGADQQLNIVFGRLIASATPEKAKQLRDAQRAWLRERNRRCELRPGSTASGDWLVNLANDKIKANCVYDVTMARLSELRKQPTANIADETVEKQEYTFPASRNSGKLYAEVSLLGWRRRRKPHRAQLYPSTRQASLATRDSESHWIVGR